MYDALTHLPDRELLLDRLQQSMAMAHRHLSMIAVVAVSLDGLKEIHANHGTEIADPFLLEMTKNMRGALREGDTLAYLGEDMFVAIMIDLPDLQSCEPMVVRFLEATDRAIAVGTHTLSVKATLGVTVFPQMTGVDAEKLLKQADHAMQHARQIGKDRHEYFPLRS